MKDGGAGGKTLLMLMLGDASRAVTACRLPLSGWLPVCKPVCLSLCVFPCSYYCMHFSLCFACVSSVNVLALHRTYVLGHLLLFASLVIWLPVRACLCVERIIILFGYFHACICVYL